MRCAQKSASRPAAPHLDAMTQIISQVIDAKVPYNGFTIVVPEVVTDLVAACDPFQVILFGSVAPGDHGPGC
jgi:hypothetical protein